MRIWRVVGTHRQRRRVGLTRRREVAGPLTLEWLSSIHNRMSLQVNSSPGGSTPNGSTPNGSTPSPSDLLQFPVLQEFAELTYQLVEAIESSKLILQRSNNEIGVLCESVRSLDLRLSGIIDQLDIARTASLEKEFASGGQATELDLADLQQALAATRSQCLMLETQQQALAIKVEGLIKRADQKAAPAPSANDAESVDRDSHGTAHQPQSQSPHDQSPHDQSNDVQSNDVQSKRVSLAIAPVFPLYGAAAQIERLTPSPGPVEPSQGFATSQRRGSALTSPLFVGGVAASALLGVGLVFVGPNLFREPEPGTPAKSVPLPENPLPANAKASSSPGPVAAVSKPAPPAQDKLKIDCPDVCWVEVNRVVDGNTIYASMLKGSVEFPIGKGLQVSSGRSDILMLKINDGAPFALNAREMISSRLIKSPS